MPALCQALELLGGAFAHRAVARQDDRVLGAGDDLGRLADRLVIGRRSPRLDDLQGLPFGLVLGEVLGQLDDRRAGLLGDRQLECLADDLGDVVLVEDRLCPFGDRREHGDRVHRLMALLVQTVGVRLADDADQRRAVHVGVGDTGHQVGRARAQRAETHARPAGESAIDVGHERGGLLVAAQDEFNGAYKEGLTAGSNSAGAYACYLTGFLSRDTVRGCGNHPLLSSPSQGLCSWCLSLRSPRKFVHWRRLWA